jgi:hypothetical protein
MESEFIALAVAGKEAEWLRNMLLDINLWPQLRPAISLHFDSEVTMSSVTPLFWDIRGNTNLSAKNIQMNTYIYNI